MRSSPVIRATVALVVLVASPAFAQQPAPPKPYTPVIVSAPTPAANPGLDAFRKEVAAVAQRKDRAGLAKLVVTQGFFWMGEKGDQAKKKPGIDNLSDALDLNAKDGSGWDALLALVADANAVPFPDRPGAVCAPSGPQFDDAALEKLAKDTGTDIGEWGYPSAAGLEVRSQPRDNAPPVEKLGMHFVRVLPDDGNPAASQTPWLRVVTPSGKTGFVPEDAITPVGGDQICYMKDASGAWKIAGYLGGG